MERGPFPAPPQGYGVPSLPRPRVALAAAASPFASLSTHPFPVPPQGYAASPAASSSTAAFPFVPPLPTPDYDLTASALSSSNGPDAQAAMYHHMPLEDHATHNYISRRPKPEYPLFGDIGVPHADEVEMGVSEEEPEQAYDTLNMYLEVDLDDPLTFDTSNNISVEITEWAGMPGSVLPDRLWRQDPRHVGGRENCYSASRLSLEPRFRQLSNRVLRQVPGTRGPRMLEPYSAMFEVSGNMYQDVYTTTPYNTSLLTTPAAREWAEQGKTLHLNVKKSRAKELEVSAGYANRVFAGCPSKFHVGLSRDGSSLAMVVGCYNNSEQGTGRIRSSDGRLQGNVHTETAQFSLVPVDSVYAHETFTAFAASQQDLTHQGVTTTAPVYHSDTLPAGYAVVWPLKKLKKSEQHKGDPRIENKRLSARLWLFQRDNKLLRTEIDEQAAKIRRLEAFVPT
ncbi:hypothetical protein JCM5296_001737 [Sporobolomyces johnsonii]